MISCIVLGFIILLPAFFALAPFPQGEEFSELWLLDSNHMIENGGFQVSVGKTFSVFLGMGNEMGTLKFYKVYVKLANSSDTLPNRADGSPSPLQPIFELNLFLKNHEEAQEEIISSFEDVSFENNVCKISRIVINNQEVPIDKILVWDENNGGFYCQLIFELWIFDKNTSDFQFHNRSVWFWLNLTTKV